MRFKNLDSLTILTFLIPLITSCTTTQTRTASYDYDKIIEEYSPQTKRKTKSKGTKRTDTGNYVILNDGSLWRIEDERLKRVTRSRRYEQYYQNRQRQLQRRYRDEGFRLSR